MQHSIHFLVNMRGIWNRFSIKQSKSTFFQSNGKMSNTFDLGENGFVLYQIIHTIVENWIHLNLFITWFLDTTRIRVGPQMALWDSFVYITYAFYSQCNTGWIANMEIGLDPNNSVMKRLWCRWLHNTPQFWLFDVGTIILVYWCYRNI